jgi:Domain of unknown function (DUF4440)
MLKKAFFILILFTNLSLFGDEQNGEELERKMWEHVKAQKWDELGNMISPYFQSAVFDAVSNKEQYIKRSKTSNISDYNLSNFKVTSGPELQVVTYNVAAAETIDGKRILSNAIRLSVWQKAQDKWQIVGHAILIPVPTNETKKGS